MKRGFTRAYAGTVSLKYRFGAALLALCFCLLFSLPAFAGKTEPRVPISGVDLQRRGSVQVLVRDSKENPLSGGTLHLYGVATVTQAEGRQSFAMTEAFFLDMARRTKSARPIEYPARLITICITCS